MIGAHELLLIVRAQNQASSALSRISRDIARLESKRAIAARQASLQLRMQQQLLQAQRLESRITSITSANGKRNLDIQRRRVALQGRAADLEGRVLQLSGRTHSIQTAQVRNANRLWDLAYKRQRAEEKMSKFVKEQRISTSAAGQLMVGGRIASAPGYAGVTDQYRDMTHDLEKLDRQIEEAKMQTQGLEYRSFALDKSAAALSTQIANVSQQMKGLNAEEAAQREEAAMLAREYQVLTKSMELTAMAQKEVNHAMDVQSLEKMQTRMRALSHVGRVAQMAGLVGTAASAYAAVQAANFQTQSALAATQARPVGRGAAFTARMTQGVMNTVLQQMNQFPAAAADMNKAVYDIFSGTNIQSVGQMTKMLKLFNMEAVAGGTDLNTMVQAGITLFNNYPSAFKNATAAGNEFFAMVRYGRGNAADFASAMSSIIPIAKQTGQSMKEVFGTLAAASRFNPNVKQDAQGYARTLQLIARSDVVAGFKNIGINVIDPLTKHVRNLVDIAAEVPKKFKTPAEAINFFKNISMAATGRGTSGTIQAQRFWANLINHVRQYRIVMGQVNADTNEFTQSYKILSQQPGVQWQVFTNRLKALVIILGQQMIPMLIAVTKEGSKWIKWFNDLSPHTKHFIGEAIAIGSALTLVAGAIATIIGSFGSLIVMLKLMGKTRAMESGGGGLLGLGAEAGSISVWAGGLTGAILILVKFHKQVMDVVNALGGLGNVIKLIGSLLPVLIFTRQIMSMIRLTTAAYEASGAMAALQASMVPLAGLVVTATVIVLERHVIQNAIQTALGDTLSKEINPYSGRAKGITFGQKVSHWLFTPYQYSFTKGFYQAGGGMDPRQRVAAAYREYAKLNKFKLNPETFTKFTNEMSKFNLGLNSSASDWEAFLRRFDKSKAQLRDLGKYFNNFLGAYIKAGRAMKDPAKHPVVVTGATSPKAQRDARQWIRLIEQAKKAVDLDPTNLVKQRKYAELQTALEKHYKNQPALLAAINAVLGAYDSNIKKVTKDQQQLSTSSADVASGIKSMYDSLLQSNQQMFGSLMQGPFMQSQAMQRELQVGYKPTGADYIKDARQQLHQYRRETTLLNQLTASGAPPELIAQLETLDPKDAIQKIRALKSLTPRELQGYYAVIKRGQDLVHQQTMQQLRAQLKDYRKYGKQTGLQIIAGIKDAFDPGATTELKNLVKSIFGTSGGGGGAGGGGRRGHGGSNNKNNSDNVTLTINVGDGNMTKKELEHAIWVAYTKYHRHRKP